jgi:hypothetical protein
MLKYPSHTMALDALLDVYPEARFIVTHRDPATSITSVSSLVHHGSSPLSQTPDPLYLGLQWTKIVEEQLRRLIAVRERVGDDRFFDIEHGELVRAPMQTLERLYAWLGAEITPSARAGFEARIASNPKGVYGTHRYEPETYGIDVGAVHEQFRFYTDHFNVPLETRR